MARIGNLIFAAYQAPVDLQKDSIPGVVVMLNMSDTPWCEEAWKRRGVNPAPDGR